MNTTTNPPRQAIAVFGAGAVGCYYGALLARAGHDVVLIGRPAHVAAIRAGGLRLQTAQADERIALRADTAASAAAGAALVLVCVKSGDTEDAAALLRPHLAPDTLLLSLQNGVDNAERLRALLPQPVAATVVYVATEMAGPGHVRHHGRGELVVAANPWGTRLEALFGAAGVPLTTSPDVRAALWAKLVANCAYNAMSALAQMPYGALVEVAGVRELIARVIAECRAVAQADGVALPADIDAAVARIAQTMPGQRSSTAQDLARGRPSEIDHLNGYVVRRGRALGVPTPVNQTLQTLVHVAEAAGAQSPSSITPAQAAPSGSTGGS